MNAEEALQFVRELVLAERGTPLNDKESYLFQGAWEGKTYKQIRIDYPINCKIEHLMNVGGDLWRLLTDVLGQKVSMNNIHGPVDAAWRKKQQALPQPEQDNEEMPLPNPTSPDVDENPPDPHLPSAQGDEAVSGGALIPRTSIDLEYTFQYTIALIVENPDNITRENVLRETRVKPVKADSLKLFGLFDAPFGANNNRRLEDLPKNLPQEQNRRWLEELAESVYLALQGRLNHYGSTSREVQSTFRSSEGKLFRAILHRMEKLSDDSDDVSVRFIVIFEEHISRGYVENAPSVAYATLLTAIILGNRLKLEVCDKYLPKLDHWQQEGLEAIKRGLREVKNSFEYIEEDAERRREGEASDQRNEVRLRDSFESEDERETIKHNMLEQEVYKKILKAADTYDNINEVRVALTELSRLNNIVMRMVMQRFYQLFNEDSP
ncbi:hypothetical protein SD81_026610 [Tolypothrix campylonemoides VB511288]|nr:hypothetical protein SD81_026610 [Tolypothrix campylonemoides VB511288]